MGFRAALVEKETCKCGGELTIQRKAGGGFVSHHSAPLCAEYEQLVREHPRFGPDGVAEPSRAEASRANAEQWAATHGRKGGRERPDA